MVADRPRHVNLLLLLRLVAETAATVLLTVALARSDPTGRGSGVLTAAGIMVVVSYVFIGVGPRTLGRQHPYELGVALAAPVRALATLLGPLTRLLILIGNALTPGRASGRARSRPRSSCASSSTWPAPAASSTRPSAR